MIGWHRRVARAGLAFVVLTGSSADRASADDPREAFGLGRSKPKPTPSDLAPTCDQALALPCPSGPHTRETAPAAQTTWLTAARLARLPLADANLDDAAALVVGSGRDDMGPYFAGATGVENRWLLDGVPIESARSGALATRVPMEFFDAVTVTSGGFSARDAALTGAVVAARLREGRAQTRVLASALIGAGLAPPSLDRAVGEYRPFDGRLPPLRSLSLLAVGDGTLAQIAGGQLWWAGGIAPRLDDRTLFREAFLRIDADGDGRPDTDARGRIGHEPINTIERNTIGYSVPLLARIGLRGRSQQLAITALVSLARDLRWTIPAEESASGLIGNGINTDLLATWDGRWGVTSARAQVSWHRDARDESARRGADVPSVALTEIPSATTGIDSGDAAVRAACADGGCPLGVGTYQTGGVGRLVDTAESRPRITGELTHAIGDHHLATGILGEAASLRISTHLSGGLLRQQVGLDSFVDTRLVAVGRGNDSCGVGVACDWLDSHQRTVHARHAAAWIVDTWRPNPAIAVEYGVRGEASQLGDSIDVRDLLPRTSAAWDFLGGGRSRAYLGWGRYAAVPSVGVAERILAGPAIYQERTEAGQISTALTVPTDLPIDPAARGVRIDEVLGGVDLGVADLARVGIGARYRHLGRILEDDHGWLTTGGHRSGTPATREFTEVTATVDTSPTATVHVRVGYAWSHLFGNWPGPWDPREGSTLYTSSLFAAQPVNASGPLPGDQPHRFFAEVASRGRGLGFDLDMSLRASASSGAPRSVRAGSTAWLLPRGSAGRLPTLAQANFHIRARRGKVTLVADVFNLFNRQGLIAVDELYLLDDQSISGGNRSDLIYLKDVQTPGKPPRLNARYDQPIRVQVPLAAHLGVRVDL